MELETEKKYTLRIKAHFLTIRNQIFNKRGVWMRIRKINCFIFSPQ
jgi:hypothetical protein